MTPALELAHMVRFERPEIWNGKRIRELAQKALAERDALALRVAQLERALRQVPKFQGMTELA